MTHFNDLPQRRVCLLGVAGLAAAAAEPAQAQAAPGAAGHASTPAILRSEAQAEWFEVIPGERMRVRSPGDATRGALSIVESVVAPGLATPLHYHMADEIFLVLDGRLRLSCGGVGHDLTTGASAVVPAGAHHGFTNLTDQPVRLLAVFAPGGMEELFIRLGRTPAHEWPQLARQYGTFVVGPPITG